MKKITILTFVIISVLYCNAQKLSEENTLLQYQSKNPDPIKHHFIKNQVKLNLASLLINNYSFSYERSLSRKITFSAGYSFMPNTSIASTTLGKRLTEAVDENDSDISRVRSSGNAYTGEFRFYGGRHAGARGLYISIYGRFSTLKIDYPYDYITSNKQYTIPLKGDTKMFGGGIMFGVQWLIAKRVTLDWSIIGAHYGNIKGTANAVVDLTGMSVADKQELKNELNDMIEINGKKYINSTVTNNGIQAIINGPFAGARTGLSLGIAF